MCHIATKSVNAFQRPEAKYVKHLNPSVRNGVEMACIISVIYTIVKLNSFIPVIDRGKRRETIIASSLCWKLEVFIITVSQVDLRREKLSGYIIKIV